MTFAGAPAATAEVQHLTVRVGDFTHGDRWVVEVKTSDCSGPTWILDNGKVVGASPFTAIRPDCERNGVQYIASQWRPTTLGTHHIVAEQRAADGTVLSSMSQDVEVKQLLCPLVDTGSAGYIACTMVSGSAR